MILDFHQRLSKQTEYINKNVWCISIFICDLQKISFVDIYFHRWTIPKMYKELINIICFYSGINVFKIINSMYSRKILDILSQAVYTINTNYLIHRIVSSLGVVSKNSYDDSFKF